VNEKVRKAILATILIAVLGSFAKIYSNTFQTASEDFQSLYFAIGIAFGGIAFHFLKNHPKLQNQKITMETSELLMLIMSPTYVSFKILKETFHNDPYPIIITIILALSSWYIVTLIRTSKLETKDEKVAYSNTMLFYWLIILGLLPFIWLATLPRS
jgi:hypothetical protein